MNSAEGLKQFATRIQLAPRTILAREGIFAFIDAIEQYQYNLRGTRGGPAECLDVSHLQSTCFRDRLCVRLVYICLTWPKELLVVHVVAMKYIV